jgi:hypothetical protein
MILVPQAAGALAGVLLAFLNTKVTESEAQPAIPTLCPLYTQIGEDGVKESGCRTNDAISEVFFGEMMASSFFVIFWLIIVHMDLKVVGKASNLLKPILLFMLASFTGSLGATFARGAQNPTLALELALWARSQYGEAGPEGGESKWE